MNLTVNIEVLEVESGHTPGFAMFVKLVTPYRMNKSIIETLKRFSELNKIVAEKLIESIKQNPEIAQKQIERAKELALVRSHSWINMTSSGNSILADFYVGSNIKSIEDMINFLKEV